MTTQDFKFELRLMGMGYDAFGTIMEAWFQIAYHLSDRDIDIPDEWGFSPPATLKPYAEEDSYWFDIFIDATDEQLLHWGKLCCRYRQFIEHYNPNLIY